MSLPSSDAPNHLVATGTIDSSAARTLITLESGFVASVPTALLMANADDHRSADEEGRLVVPVIAEELVVSKRAVALETVRLVKSSESRLERLEVPLAREHWNVERVAMNVEVAERAGVRDEGDVTLYPVYEERLVTRKALFLVEELRVRKVVETRHETVEQTLLHEHVSVERTNC